jgi:translation initiation factor 2 alpha subunit (eIF-2alpha)
MKLARIISKDFQEALRKLNGQALPAKVAYKLKSISKTVDSENQKYEEVRIASLKKYGEKDENGEVKTREDGNVMLSKEGAEAFLNDLNELVNIEVELPTIRIDDLGDVKLTAEDLMNLEGLITD